MLPLGKSSDKANVNYAIELARSLDATLYVSRLFKDVPRSGGLLEGNLTVGEITQQEIQTVITSWDAPDVKIVATPLEGDDLIEAIGKFHQLHTIDCIVLSPKHHDVNEANYLGSISGAVLKQTEIPVLIVPDTYMYTPIERILMAVKSGIVRDEKVLEPLKAIQALHQAEVRLLQVKTPDYLPEDAEFNSTLGAIVSSYKSSENATLFQGVLEHLNENNPNMLCVFRRKRGFFEKLWEEDAIKKSNFESRIPLLVLKEAE